jgi:ankyrin repeat protein
MSYTFGGVDRPVVETLIDAARGDSTTALRSFLEAGADAEAFDKYGYSALHYAAMNSKIQNNNNRFTCAPSFIDHLLAAGADVHARNRAGYTALHCAMLREEVGDLELCIERLVRAGARVEELTNSGETALALALIAGRGNVAKCLLGFGARMTAEDLRRHARARWIRTQRLWHTEEQALLLRIAKFDARVSSIEAAGGFAEYAIARRRVHAGLVCKCAARSFPLDAAGLVVDFLWRPGGGRFLERQILRDFKEPE